MSRFTLYLCLLVGLIAVVSVAAQGNTGGDKNINDITEACRVAAYNACKNSPTQGKLLACLVDYYDKHCR